MGNNKNWPETYLPGVQNFILFSILNNKYKKKLICDCSVAQNKYSFPLMIKLLSCSAHKAA